MPQGRYTGIPASLIVYSEDLMFSFKTSPRSFNNGGENRKFPPINLLFYGKPAIR